MRRLAVALGAIVAASAASAPASAAPDDLVGRPIVLEAGQLAAQVAVETSLASQQLAHPLSVAPDLWFGVTPRLTVGIVDSMAAVDRVDFGSSLCVRTASEEPGSCPDLYHGSGLDVRYLAWSHGGFSVAPRVRYLIRDFTPWKPAGTIGALARWQRGRWSLTTDPYLQIALANNGLGNDSALVVPLFAALQPTRRWTISLETGYVSDLAVWRDGYHVPIAGQTTVRATAHLDIGAQVGLTSALGPQNNVKQRELWLLLGWRT